MKMNKLLLGFLAIGLFAVSCSSDDDFANQPEVEVPVKAYENGILIANEGPFNNGTGTVTFISNDFSVIEDGIFKKENGEDLGNIVQSIGFSDENAYIVVNNSHKIHVVDRYTFKSKAVIEDGLLSPRYFTVSNGKGYVTNWGDTADEDDDFVAVIDLTTNTVSKSIPVVLGPEAIIANEDYIYVAHQGGYGQNNKVSIIDADTDLVDGILTVGDFPNSMQWDASGNLWVLSSGAPAYTGAETNGTLSKINTTNNTIEKTFSFLVEQHPSNLITADGILYYGLGGALYAIAPNADSLPTETFMDDVSFYAMAVQDDKLFGTDAKDYASKGDLNIYDLPSKTLTTTLQVGLIPGGIYFN